MLSHGGNCQGHIITLTCDQVLVLVDVELHTAQALGGVCVDVLHMLNFVEAFVHLQDTRNKSKVEKTAGKGGKKRQLSIHPHRPPELKQHAGFLFFTGIPLERRSSEFCPSLNHTVDNIITLCNVR